MVPEAREKSMSKERFVAKPGEAREVAAERRDTGQSPDPRSLEAFSRLAHELRTPLSAIAAAADVMHGERLGPIGDERYRGYAGDILDNARHALGVIERMLPQPASSDCSPPHVGNAMPALDGSALVFTEIDVNDLMARIAASIRAMLDDARIELATNFERAVPRVIADAVSLRQVVLNLVSNAIRATAPGGRVTLSTEIAPSTPLVIAVTDTGVGMSDETLRRALASAETGIGAPGFDGGTGLGLPIVARLARMNGAELAITSRTGEGTRATICFHPSRVVF